MKRPKPLKTCPDCGGLLAYEIEAVVHTYLSPKTGRFQKKQIIDEISGPIIYCRGITKLIFGTRQHEGCCVETKPDLVLMNGRIYRSSDFKD